MKRFLSVILAMLLLTAVLSGCGGSDDGTLTYGGIVWTAENVSGGISIAPEFLAIGADLEGTHIYTSEDALKDTVEIPSELGGKTVVAISDSAFKGCEEITEIIIPDTVTEIGPNAFSGCKGLKAVSIGSSVTTIGLDAFWGCSALVEVTVPASVTALDIRPFYSCSSLTAVNVEEGNTAYKSIDGVLYTADGTTLVKYPDAGTAESLVIPDEVVTVGERALDSCPVKSLYLGSGLKDFAVTGSTETGSLAGCNKLESIEVSADNAYYTAVDGILFNKDCTVLYKCPAGKQLGEYTVPEGVTEIGTGAFGYNESLTALTLPTTIVSVGNYIVRGCSALTDIYCLRTGDISFMEVAFDSADSLAAIHVTAECEAYFLEAVGDKAFEIVVD